MTELDDGALVGRANGGDREAFGELVSRHERVMLAIARAYFASEADAEDAVQDAFIRAFGALGQLKAAEQFPAWVAKITMNTCVDMLRSKSDRLSLADFATSVQVFPRFGPEQYTPSMLAQQAETSKLLKAAVGRLPEKQRVVLMLRYGEDLSHEQIAAYLGVSADAVRSRHQRAKRALERSLRALETPSS